MNLKNHFLIAMPSLNEEPFSRSVVYLFEHNEKGAMGLIINKPFTNLTIEILLSRLDINIENTTASNILTQPVFDGGPLAQEHGFIIHSGKNDFASSIAVTDQLTVTTSQDILKSIATTQEPKNKLITLGYAGWSLEQLEKEIINNDWLVTLANTDIIFDTDIEEKWSMAAQQLGIENIATIPTTHSACQ